MNRDITFLIIRANIRIKRKGCNLTNGISTIRVHLKRTWCDVIIDFHGETKPFDYYENDKRFHVRTAYRNNSVTLPHTIDRVDLVTERSPYILIENDDVFASKLLEISIPMVRNVARK